MHYVEELLLEYEQYKKYLEQYNTDVLVFDSQIKSNRNQISENDKLIKANEEKLNGTDIPLKEINDTLHKYMGHKSIEFEHDVVNNNFKLKRLDENDEPIELSENEHVQLSEGETTLVAFIYFINQLNNQNTTNSDKKEDYIVVIDDPISSLDNNFVFFIVSQIKEILSTDSQIFNIEQIIFLTHHFMFFRELWTILHTAHSGKESKYKNNFSYYLMKRKDKKLYIEELPKLYQDSYTEYFYLFQQLYSIVKDIPKDDYTIKYHAPNISRKLLETFSLFKYGDKDFSNLKDKISIERIDKKNPKTCFDWDSIYRYVNEFSHNKSIYNEKDFTHLDMSPIPQMVLNLIKHLDYDHYKAIRKKIKN